MNSKKTIAISKVPDTTCHFCTKQQTSKSNLGSRPIWSCIQLFITFFPWDISQGFSIVKLGSFSDPIDQNLIQRVADKVLNFLLCEIVRYEFWEIKMLFHKLHKFSGTIVPVIECTFSAINPFFLCCNGLTSIN